jgi:Spy/CpxP family protein refolding chaperone
VSVTEPAGVPAPRRTRLVAALVVIMAFIAGIIVGVAGGRVWHVKGQHRIQAHGMRFMSDRVLHRLDRELDLSADQRTRIEKILVARTNRMEALWSGVGPQVRREIEATNSEIERVLNPDQRAKFQKLKMRFHRRRLPPPPPPR